MSNVPQHLIDSLAMRGLVPGAKVQHPVNSEYGGDPWVLGPVDQWMDQGFGVSDHTPGAPGWAWLYRDGQYATVIAPPPSAEGLQEGDAVECGPAMRAAIIELAKELGIRVGTRLQADYQEWPRIYWRDHGDGFMLAGTRANGNVISTPEAFIAKMRVTASQPKPIKIDGHEVKWEKGQIKVGCQTIPNDTVRAIAAKLIDE